MLDRKIAWIDLTNRTVKVEDIPMEWRRKYLGGRGIMSFLLWSLTNGKTDPWGPEAPLLVGLGWMTGIPTFGGRVFFSGLGPNPSRVGFGSVGGHFGPEMKYAGFDLLVIRGKSETPVYLMITDDNIEILDADYMWGLKLRETQDAIRRHHDDHEIRSLVIGPAGENLVRGAGIMTGWKNAGGSGSSFGTLMGGKKLKAIAARGTKNVKLAHPKEYLSWMKEQQDLLQSRKWIKAMGKYGTPLLLTISNEGGWVGEGKNVSALTADKLDPYTVGMGACAGCSVHCRHRFNITEGKYAGVMGEGPEYSTNSSMAGHRIFDIEADLALTDQCNQLGVGILSGTGNVHRLLEEGVITEKDIGYYVGWGDADALSRLMDDMVYRRTPFGDILADGADGVKRLPPAAQKVRSDWSGSGSGGVKSFAFAGFVNILPGYTKTNRPGIDVLGLPSKLLEKIYGGGPVSSSYAEYEGKGRMVWWHERHYAMGDCLGICRFQTVFNSPNMPKDEDYIEMIRLTTGMDFSMDELNDISERITCIEKLTLVEHLGSARDSHKLTGERLAPLKGGVLKGNALHVAKFEEFLDQYYGLHEWDDNGLPKKELVKRLGVAKAKGL